MELVRFDQWEKQRENSQNVAATEIDILVSLLESRRNAFFM
jgi:hypothetical protein